MKRSSEWVDITLRFAGIVNVVWGLIFALFTNPLFRWAQLPEPPFLFPWQLIGIASIIFGLGYYIASFNVTKNSLIVMIGFALKVASAILVWKSVLTQDLSLPLALYFSAKDLLWLAPFGLVLYHIFKKWQTPEQERVNPVVPFAETLVRFRTNQGRDLLALSHEHPVLLVFLPHEASPMFQSTVDGIRQHCPSIKQQGTHLVLVRATPSGRMTTALQKAGLAQEAYVSDPDYTMYNTFNLKRATLRQTFGLSTWQQRWMSQGLAHANLNKLVSQGFRMPGAFLLYRGELRKSYYCERTTDRADYGRLAELS